MEVNALINCLYFRKMEEKTAESRMYKDGVFVYNTKRRMYKEMDGRKKWLSL